MSKRKGKTTTKIFIEYKKNIIYEPIHIFISEKKSVKRKQ